MEITEFIYILSADLKNDKYLFSVGEKYIEWQVKKLCTADVEIDFSRCDVEK